MSADANGERLERRARLSLVFLTVMLGASAVTFARLLAPFEIGKDQALQLEAAQRLVGGLGLTSTYFASHYSDISQQPTPNHLTWWPPGFSLLAAAFFWTGMPLAAWLKGLYATITMLGWAGWGCLAQPFLLGSQKIRWHLIAAALLPVCFTPSWLGTDAFLWAGVPYVTLWLFASGTSPYPLRWIIAAGLLVGGLFSIRYASALLVPPGLLVLLQCNWRDGWAFARRSLLFAGTAAVIAAATLAYVHAVSDGGFTPSYINLTRDDLDARTFLRLVASGLPAAGAAIVGAPIPDELASKLPRLREAIGVASFAAVAALLPILWITSRMEHRRRDDTMMFSVALLPFLAMMFLIAVTYFTTIEFNPVGYGRYYQPLMLCGVLTWCAVVGGRQVKTGYRLVGGTLLGMTVIYYCGYMPVAAVVRRDPVALTRLTLGFTPARSLRHSSTSLRLTFPSNQVYSVKEGSRRKIRELQIEYPGAVFYVQNHPYYVYDGFRSDFQLEHADFRLYPNDINFWKVAYTSKPLVLIWVLNLSSLHDSTTRRLLETGQVVFHDLFEKTIIVVDGVPAGCKPWSRQYGLPRMAERAGWDWIGRKASYRRGDDPHPVGNSC